MVEITEIRDKDGKQLTTKDGISLRKYKFTAKDIFIPQSNKLIRRITEFGDMFTLKCIIRDFEEENIVYISLTPTQANYLNNLINDGIRISEHMFISYEYKKDDKSYIGIVIYENIEPKSFKDFE